MSNVDTKVCTKEGVEKPVTEFHKDKRNSDGYSSWCGPCRNKAKRERRKRKRSVDHKKTATKSVTSKEKEAMTKCHISAFKALRQMYPQTYEVLLKKEIAKNPVLVAKKWRQLPETEGV